MFARIAGLSYGKEVSNLVLHSGKHPDVVLFQYPSSIVIYVPPTDQHRYRCPGRCGRGPALLSRCRPQPRTQRCVGCRAEERGVAQPHPAAHLAHGPRDLPWERCVAARIASQRPTTSFSSHGFFVPRVFTNTTRMMARDTPWSIKLISAFPARGLRPLCMGAPSRARAQPRRCPPPLEARLQNEIYGTEFLLPELQSQSTRHKAARGVCRRASAVRHCAAPCHGPSPLKRGLKCRTSASTYNIGREAGATVPASLRHQGPRRPGPRRPAPDYSGTAVTALPALWR